MNQEKKITFGILCNNLVFEKWEADCIHHLIQHKDIELKLLVVNNQFQGSNAKRSFIHKLTQYPYSSFLFRAYKRYILKARSFLTINFEDEFKRVPRLNCNTVKKGNYSAYFNDDDVTQIKGFQLDFMLRFGFNIIKGTILQSCKYGIWSFHHADNDFIRGGPIGFWEIYLKRNTTAAILQQLNDQLDQGKVLRKGYLKTVEHSYAENIDQLAEMASVWPLQVCIDLLNEENIAREKTAQNKHVKLYKYPNNGQFLYFVLRLMLNKINFHIEQLFIAESWQIARFAGDLASNPNQSKPEFLSTSAAENYCADPFFWPDAEVKKMLFEYYDYKENIGKIALADLEGRQFKLLDFGIKTHLSYPFCFMFENEVYCLPEQAGTNAVALYKLDTAGNVTKVRELIQHFAARDSSLIFYENRWWLFCTKASYFENAALFIFYSNALDEPFTPHQNNPVKVNVQNGRPAGTMFIKNNELFRPAQNSAKHYGNKVNINKITRLSTRVFHEEIEQTITPETFGAFIGIHHLVYLNGQTLIDLKRTRFSMNNFRNQLSRKISRILGRK